MPKRIPTRTAAVLTVGHSNRSLEEFLHLLQAHEASLVVDVRKMPRSLRNPKVNGDQVDIANYRLANYRAPSLLGLPLLA